LLAVLICAVQSTVASVVNATAAILTFDIYMPLIKPDATEKQKVRFGIWASVAAVIAGIGMAIAISRMSAGIYQYMQTINALVAPPFAAILWVGLLWKRTNGAGAIAAIVAGFGAGIAFKLAVYFWDLPSWLHVFGNQAPICLAISILACVAGTLVHPAPTPGTEENPVTFWNSGETLRAGLGDRWYNSVVLWGGLSLLLTLTAMVIFSQLFFPTPQ
jgi:SSS family solute:Na+ symporter